MADRQTDHAPYLSALDGLSSTELTDRQRAVEKTMETAGWIVLTELWGAREAAEADKLVRLSSGSTAEAFVERTAFIRGLREAMQAPHALAKVAEDKRQEAIK